ncbi:hypothetical protein Q4E40_02615 [Pontibacter sp. BT731]|uniref:hypothetical protein n=1 Tax=Pontibacter coccineus TaxID=3063328 RepID=UPI0026E2FA79|nr:hypothetical protein [Pontibacter sp. BT731]MDO6389005.1 hypothetical protein [Pontibacter sp. BT731]
MAVAPERIKERLRSNFSGVNLSKQRLDELAARLSQKPADDADDAAIDQVLSNANDFMPFADIAREDDRVRTLLANQKAPEPQPQPTPQPKTDDTPEWAKALMQEVNSLKAEKTKSTIQQQLKEKLKDVPETFYSRIALPESADELDTFAESIKTDYTALKQELINANAGAGNIPLGTVNSSAIDADIAQWAEQSKS